MNGRRWRRFVVCVCIAGATALQATAALGAPLEPTALPAPLGSEVEPNDTAAQATPLQGDMRIRASLLPAGDVDYYSFEARAGDRVFAETVTAGSMTAPADTKLTLLGSDGTTVLEEDDNGGSQLRSGSSIAGVDVPSDGVYFLRIEDVRGVAATPAPYDLYLALRSGVAAKETEPNDKPEEANPLVNGEVTGVHEAAVGEKDWFAVNLQAGDTVFLSLDLDPERNGGSFDGELGFGLAGDLNKAGKGTQILTVDDPQSGEAPDTTPSEGLAMTVSKGGTYYAYVDVANTKLDTGGPQATYDLVVTVFPAAQPSCRTYSSFASALLDGATTAFPIQVDDPAVVGQAAIRLKLEETVMADLDVSLRSPAGLELPLFTDIGETAPGGQRQLEAVFDDFAAMPSVYTAVRPLGLQPDVALAGFDGEPAQGTWMLMVKDDTLNGSAGNLAEAGLVLCPEGGSAGGGGSGGGGGGLSPASSAANASTPPPAPPQLSNFKIAPSKFRAAKAGPTVLAKKPKSAGALVSYDDSAAAQTNVVLFEIEAGRKVGRRCVRETAGNAAKKPCTRLVKVTSWVRQDAPGRNKFGFSGRVAARRLPPGEYQLQAKAYLPSGLTSAPVSANFTILAPPLSEATAGRG